MKRSETFVDAFTKILFEQNAIKHDEALALKKVFFDRSKETFDDFLLEEGLASRTEILNALSQYYDVPAFDVVGHFFNHDKLHEFPKDFLLRNQIIPLEQDENILFMIASNPNDPELLPKIGNYVSYDIQFLVGIARDITDAVKEFYDKALSEVPEDSDIQQEQREQVKAQDIMNGEKEE